jgi:chromosomal replication initiator protein
LDDIQFIIGKEQTQEGFFHTFNSLHMEKKQIVITCDRPAKMLNSLTDRIRTRLEGGLVVDIQPPDLETRVAILESKASKHGVKVPSDVLFLIAEISPSNVRELEGNLNRVIAYSQLTQIPITLEIVNRALPVNITNNAVFPITEKSIINTVCKYFRTEPKLLLSPKRDKKTSLARHITMYLLRLEMNKQFAEIGRIFGGRDHTTVIHACNRISSLIKSDDALRSDVKNILANIQD